MTGVSSISEIDPAVIPPHSGPLGLTPSRQPWSVRRTSTIDTAWPEGLGQVMHVEGRARDLLTAGDPAAPRILAEGGFLARLTADRQILALETSPAAAGAQALVGSRAGSQLRAALAHALPGQVGAGTPLHLLLDDLAGASLVAPWAWSQWSAQWRERIIARAQSRAGSERGPGPGVCIGFSPQALAMRGPGSGLPEMHRAVGPLDGNGDPFAWHGLAVQSDCMARRARRIEVGLDGPAIRVETHFQDSTPLPAGGRAAVHEYLVRATVDRESLLLTSLEADPRILPFGYCPAATLNTGRILGTPVRELRQRVLAEFARTEGCTHLNDVMRSLAEVPMLADRLEAARREAGAD